MNLDLNGMGEGAGNGRVAGGKEVIGGGEATVIQKVYFGNLYLLKLKKNKIAMAAISNCHRLSDLKLTTFMVSGFRFLASRTKCQQSGLLLDTVRKNLFHEFFLALSGDQQPLTLLVLWTHPSNIRLHVHVASPWNYVLLIKIPTILVSDPL